MLRHVLSRRIARQCVQERSFNHIADPSSSTVATQKVEVPLYRPPPEEPDYELEYPKSLDDLPSEEYIKRKMKFKLSLKAIEGLPEYEESDLRDFYKNLVLSGVEDVPEQLPQIAAPEGMSSRERTKLIGELAERLQAPREEGTALIPVLEGSVPQHIALTSALISIAPEEPRGPVPIGLGVVTQSEWQALFDAFVSQKDGAGAEVLLSTMERHGVIPSTGHLDRVLELYARQGQTGEVVRLISDFEAVGLEITDKHRDSIIASYIHTPTPNAEGAMAVLTSAEDIGRPFPQSSYNLVLSHLTEATPTTQPDSRSRAMAWDLFAHMRFAAHPVPTREVYTTMIRACSTARDPQPERARDLWHDMTSSEGNQLEPTRAQYDALIRALGSTKSDYLEAYDLLRQMLSKHQEATIVPFEDELVPRVSPWVPTLETFTALLEGTKRAGDLERARWVLSEAVDLARTSAFSGHRLEGPDDEMMAAVFQTYAAWQPRYQRKDVGLREGKEGAEAEVEPEAGTSVTAAEAPAESTPNTPQSRAEAIREADLLFDRILHDVNARDRNINDHPFANVKITPRLINSYLSIHLSHAPIEQAREAFQSTWARFSQPPSTRKAAIVPNGWSYLAVLERCTHLRGQSKQREAALKWGEEAWKGYLGVLDASSVIVGNDGPANRRRWLTGVGERQVEKAWACAISLASKYDTDLALRRVDDFVARYPAQNILDGYSPHINKLKVRMMETSDIAEAQVPPHLLFADLAQLHHRCVTEENWAGVKKVKFVATSYQYALGKRRRWRLTGAGMAREVRKEREREGKVRLLPREK